MNNKVKELTIPNEVTLEVNLRDAEVSLLRDTSFGIKKNNKGLLLLEVMLTVIILSAGLTLILRSFSTSLNATKSAQYYTAASLLIEDKMWELENKGAVEAGLNQEGQFPAPYQKFNWQLITKDKPVQNQTDKINEVKLIVRWQEGKRKGSAFVTTYLPNKTQ